MFPRSKAEIIRMGLREPAGRSSIRFWIEYTTSFSLPGLQRPPQMLGSSTLGSRSRFGITRESVAAARLRPYRSLSIWACFSASMLASISRWRSNCRWRRSSVSVPWGSASRSSGCVSMPYSASSSSSSSASSSSSSTPASSSMKGLAARFIRFCGRA